MNDLTPISDTDGVSMADTLAGYLVSRDVFTAGAAHEAVGFQEQFGTGLIQASLKLGLARETDLLAAVSDYFGLPILDHASGPLPRAADVSQAASQLKLPVSWLVTNDGIVWFDDTNGNGTEQLNIALRDPVNQALPEELGKRHAASVKTWIAPGNFLDAMLAEITAEQSDANETTSGADLARLRELAEEAPVIEFVNRLFSDALEQNASDIHIEPEADFFETRFRVDGVLTDIRRHSKSMFDSTVTRIKILSGMDISERRLPQDGRQTVRVSGEEIDLRVSSLPATEGESVVIRLLRKKSDLPDMQGLGLRGETLEAFRKLIELPNGIFLVTGPTGSGKSTTLYRALEHLHRGESKLITIEDPVEYDLEGVNQVQVHSDIGLTFAKGLRAMLRQDPDVIMVGEIRDRETAEVAIQAALTGHLVFSTLHTNSAIGAYERMVDLGVEPFLLSAALRGVLGQRLLRKLCTQCRSAASDASKDMVRQLLGDDAPMSDAQVFEAQGCAVCGGSGYKGRVGVYELVDIHSMHQSGVTGDLRDAMRADILKGFGFKSMLHDALVKVCAGETSLEEIARVFGRRAVSG
ncbi:MAG: GspE/PulE family protein [Pseudomonadota bacterium]